MLKNTKLKQSSFFVGDRVLRCSGGHKAKGTVFATYSETHELKWVFEQIAE